MRGAPELVRSSERCFRLVKLMNSNDLRIGPLLVETGMVSGAELEKAVKIAAEAELPLGKALVLCGVLNQKHLEAIVELQSLLREGAIPLELLGKTMRLVCARSMSAREALAALGWNDPGLTRNLIGELLYESGQISNEILAQGLEMSRACGLPLGRTLVAQQQISANVLKVALEMQIGLRDGTVNRNEATQRLGAVRTRRVIRQNPPQVTEVDIDLTRVGQLLLAADLISEEHLLTALETSLAEGVRVGDVLVRMASISNHLLRIVLHMQMLIRNRQMKLPDAIIALSSVAKSGMLHRTTLHSQDSYSPTEANEGITDQALLFAVLPPTAEVDNT